MSKPSSNLSISDIRMIFKNDCPAKLINNQRGNKQGILCLLGSENWLLYID